MSKDLKEFWPLDRSFVFLNHGSFGAVPYPVLEKQHKLRLHMESQPVRFFQRELDDLLLVARERLAGFIGGDPEGLVFVPNATTGVNTVLKSLRFQSRDEILVTNHTYNACKNVVDFVAARDLCQVKVVTVPFPTESAATVKDVILDSITHRTRLLLIDHVTSPTALIFPVREIVGELEALGVDVLVDGAHAPGMIPLDMHDINAAYYTGNCHKWLCAPKGSAFLYIREDKRKHIRPLTTSHGANSLRKDKSFLHLEFDWTGTGDYTPYVLIPDSIDFLASLYPGGIEELMKRNHEKALEAKDMICRALEVPPPCPDHMNGSMAAIPLLPLQPPNKTAGEILDPVQEKLYHEFGIEVPIVAWPACDQRLVRISAQAYNAFGDYLALVQALRSIFLD